MSKWPGFWQWQWISAAAGGALWCTIFGLRLVELVSIGLIEQILLLAPLTIVPLSLPLLRSADDAPILQRIYQLVTILQPIGALLVLAAFLLPASFGAALLVTGWLGVTGLLALSGLIRFATRRRVDVSEISIDAGLVYIAVGGGWLVLSRLGANPLGFGDLIVLLTAVHFHFAGFAAPIITGVTGRFIKTNQGWYTVSAGGVVAGMPLVAAGITFSPVLELVGALVMATGLAILATLITLIVLQVEIRLAQILLAISTLSLILGVLLICAYAVGHFTGYHLVTIPLMVRLHGTANALGFALCGLTGWNILQYNRLRTEAL